MRNRAWYEVISVAATDQADGHGGSNHNGDVELSAPGIGIVTTDLDNGYRVGSGTSAATPYVAGVAAVARQKYPAYTAAQIRDLSGRVFEKGLTLVPLDLHWKDGRAKLEVGLAKGKKQHDKREAEKEREWQREQQRLLRKRA